MPEEILQKDQKNSCENFHVRIFLSSVLCETESEASDPMSGSRFTAEESSQFHSRIGAEKK